MQINIFYSFLGLCSFH